ncbi:MAG TPA: AsmA family protein [candidate division Zixibacteria bacterium]|nr:AsmA family protein [candidate division Zixibacteria bacterium]
MLKSRAKLAAVILAALAVLGLVVPPYVNVKRFKHRMTESMSAALGRPVTVGDITLRMLPQPGFDMDNLVVGDDPAYGAEPILRADQVTAYLRVSSLWRGRLEVARLSLKYPSLNLVRAGNGHWNVESLLWKAARTPTAPTVQRQPEARFRFPYIAAENGRINFVHGLEKNVFSLTEADFSLYSPAENQWRMHLEAKPVRTDKRISDTGVLKLDGVFGRADYLRNAPVHTTFVWENAQLGQVTKLLSGEDMGWRGNIELSGHLNGEPDNLKFDTSSKITEFRRWDIYGGGRLDLQSQCEGTFSSTDESLHGVRCRFPFPEGLVLVTGDVVGSDAHQFDLNITSENLAARTVANIAKHTKKEIAQDLDASGTLTGSFHVARTAQDSKALWIGNGVAANVVLRSSVLEKDLPITKAMFSINAPLAPKPARHARGVQHVVPDLASANAVAFDAFEIPLGGAQPAMATARLDSDGYQLNVRGDASLPRLQQIARAVGVGAPKFALIGKTTLDMQLRGAWMNSDSALVGTMLWRDASAEIPGVASPVQLSQAHVVLDANRMNLLGLVGAVGKTHFTGTAMVPRSCTPEAQCDSVLNLQFEEIDPELWNAALNPRVRNRWYKLFGASDDHNIVATLKASGHISARRVQLGFSPATNFECDFTLRDGRAELKNTSMALLGGQVESEWAMHFKDTGPEYAGKGQLTRVNIAQLSAATKTNLGTGLLNGRWEAQMTGWNAEDFVKSAEGKAQLNWSNGTLRSFAFDGHAPMKVNNFSATFTLAKGKLSIEGGKLQSGAGVYKVSGTATPGHDLDLQFLAPEGTSYRVNGNLQKPQVVALPAATKTEAKLAQ